MLVVAGTIDPERERELLERFGRELAALVEGKAVTIKLSPLVAWNVMALLQLAVRHPAVGGTTPGEHGRTVIAALRAVVATDGALAEVAARGDGPPPGPVAALHGGRALDC